MTETHMDILYNIPLLNFLNAYPEPAFILRTNSVPHLSSEFIYGNPALYTLIFDHDDSGVLDSDSFFSAVANSEDLVWLSNPITPQSVSATISEFRNINIRPAWLPRDHTPLNLELTPTPIDLPAKISGGGISSKSHVFIATPRKTAMDLLRSGSRIEYSEHQDSELPINEPPPVAVSIGHHSSRKSESEPSSRRSQHAYESHPVLMPSKLINVFPWEKTTLGPRALWPETLKTMVRYLMEKPIASAIFWGWPHLVMIYNDAYARMISIKHPSIFGQPGPVGLGELWEWLGAVAERCHQGKSTYKTEDRLFWNTLTELHLPEEVYHWHWTPIWLEDGAVGGIFHSTYDVTQKVIAERRMAGMFDISASLADVRSRDQYAERIMTVLSKNEFDIPFFAMYWCETENARNDTSESKKPPLAAGYLRHFLSSVLINITLNLVGSVGVPEGHPAARKVIKYTLDPMTYQPIQMPIESNRGPTSPAASESPPQAQYNSLPPAPARTGSNSSTGSQASSAGLEFVSALASGHIELVDPLPEKFAAGLDGRGFRDIPRAAALLPISTSFGRGTAREDKPLPYAVLLVGLNTRRAYDADYSAWLESVRAALSDQLTLVLQREADVRMIEEREKMDKAKTLFFTNASHELRNPLALIQAPLEQLSASQNLTEASRYKVQLAMRNAKRLRKLVDSILDMSKLEAGRLHGYFRPVQLGRVTSDIAALFRSIAEKNGIAFEVVDETANAPFVYVDVDFWEKITCNLLSNAFKYTVKGKITILITYDSTSAYMHVQDTGVGIPKEHLGQVFERFHRVNSHAAEGTGIGLSLTKELVALHGGDLTVVSDSSGSIFTVTLPQGRDHLPERLVHDTDVRKTYGASSNELEYWMGIDVGQNTPPMSSGDDEGESPASSTLFFEKDDTILVVDDNEDMRRYVRTIFSTYITVLEARDGYEALSIIKLQKLNAILCDVMMPGMSGLELLAKLRDEKKTKLVPVIFVTASDDANLLSGKVEGVVDCITKPFRVRDLLARVHLQVQLGKRRINLEEEFEVRSRELQILSDLSPVGIFRTNAAGKLTYLNPTWYHVTGYPAERDRDEWLEYIHPVSTQDALRIWRACFKDFKTSSVRLRWKSDVWTHACIAPMFAPDDTFAGAFCTFTDITDQHRAEEARIALAEEKEHIAALKAKDSEEQRLLEVERRRAQELLIDVTSHELRQPVSAIIQNAEVIHTNMKGMRDLLQDCQKRNVSYMPTELVLAELEDDLQAMESITQCGLAQARIANDVLSLSRIQLNVLSIIPTEFDIRREAGQILMVFRNELVSKNIDFRLDLERGADLLGITTICTDRSRFAQIITNLMTNAIRFTDMSTGQREIVVSLEIAFDPPIGDSCAPPPTLPGRGRRSRSPDPDPNSIPIYIYVSVKDSGPGLQKEDLALLFQRFQQGSNAHHVFGGSGLGLFVCRQLCTLMGGRIEVESEVGNGATFRFFIRGSLPATGHPSQTPTVAARARRSDSAHSRASGVSKTSGKSGSRPLPETPNLRLQRALHTVLARQMKRAGFTYALASNGLEAVHAIEAADAAGSSGSVPGTFDVVLMDLEMPVMDGFAATREIRQREANKTLKFRSFIIVLTGNARFEQVEAAREAGADDVMIKPYQIESLMTKMRAGYQPSN